MRIDFWFNVDNDSHEVAKMLLEVANEIKTDDIQLRLRSYLPDFSDQEKVYTHKLIHLARRKGKNSLIVLDKLLDGVKPELIFTTEELEELNAGVFDNIVKNHLEHANLNKIKVVPSLCLSHKLSLVYPFNIKDLKDIINKMKKQEKEIEYCYDDTDCIETIKRRS